MAPLRPSSPTSPTKAPSDTDPGAAEAGANGHPGGRVPPRATLRMVAAICVVSFLAVCVLVGLAASLGDQRRHPHDDESGGGGGGLSYVQLALQSHRSSGAAKVKLAVAIKTGAAVAADRIPIQQVTFVSRLRQHLYVGETPDLRVGNEEVVDVYTGTLQAALARLEAEGRGVGEGGGSNHTSVESRDSIEGGGRLKRRQALRRHSRRLARRLASANPDDRVQVDQASKGWQLDAHKNLPALRELHARFPGADWHLMIDDDSYVVLDNLLAYLAGRDPRTPVYRGSANQFIGCDGVSDWDDGPYFAHGGSGILMSRAAVEQMLPRLDECVVRYNDCWGGDVRLALCMRDAGILLEFASGHHGEPPIRDYAYPQDPCEQPLVFHHLVPWQMQTLHELERQHARARTPLTMGSVFTAFVAARDTVAAAAASQDATGRDVAAAAGGSGVPGVALRGFDLPGNDIADFAVDSGSGGDGGGAEEEAALAAAAAAAECGTRCGSHAGCVAWAVANGRCWLKGRVAEWRESDVPGAWAGYLPDAYRCAATAAAMAGAEAAAEG
ncbi:hypothetical protein HK405_002103 [Cladochytrium tenue]|nr:hypothetical protein HK405_002103 [Cladochytrium tenue]